MRSHRQDLPDVTYGLLDASLRRAHMASDEGRQRERRRGVAGRASSM